MYLAGCCSICCRCCIVRPSCCIVRDLEQSASPLTQATSSSHCNQASVKQHAVIDDICVCRHTCMGQVMAFRRGACHMACQALPLIARIKSLRQRYRCSTASVMVFNESARSFCKMQGLRAVPDSCKQDVIDARSYVCCDAA